MSLVSFLKRSYWLQDLASRFLCGVPPEVHHNLGKLAALRNAFAYTALEGVVGDYLEFGVFEGNSMMAAIRSYEAQTIRSIHMINHQPCRFFGFDSFEGLRLDEKVDTAHPAWKDSELVASYDRCVNRLSPYRRKHKIELIKGYYQDTLTPETLKNLDVKKVRICLIDCDLKSSTDIALAQTAAYWQRGTVLIFDDYFSYLGDPKSGECGAFEEFAKAHPEFAWRDYGLYGYNGFMKIVTSPVMMIEAAVRSKSNPS